jgi:hypothetical protein
MKVRIYAPLFASILVFAFAGIGVGNGQGPQWKGKIETVDGLKVVRNPNAPLYGDLKLDLREDLQIGKEDVENYIFERILDLRAANDGSIYVLDYKAGDIKKYDRNGAYLQTIGKKGQGPGEFQMPFRLFLFLKTGDLYVQDSIRIKLFDHTGKYQKETLLRNFPTEFLIDDETNIWAVASTRKDNGEYKTLIKAGPHGDILSTIVEFPYKIYQKQESANSVIAIVTGFENDLHIASPSPGVCLYGYSDKYELTAVDLSGKNLFRFAKEEVPQSFAPDEVKGPVGASMPKYKPFFYSLFSDDAGRIYAQKANPTRRDKADTRYPYDVFGKDGVFLYKLELPYARAFCIKNGYLYARHVIEDSGLEVVKRFKIGNWEKIRNSAE